LICTKRSRLLLRRTPSWPSNTSGLSITKLSEALPEEIKPRFCGIHFFNPPRYMALVELINTPTTLPQVLDDLEAFVTSNLGKGVVHAKDSPTSSPTASVLPACWPR
jgi:3-hydroxyacyl-CoA dehydrogenase